MSKEAMTLALEALKFDSYYGTGKQEAIKALEEALASEQEQGEPVAWYIREKDTATTDDSWIHEHPEMVEPLYLHPQPAQKPLTDEAIATVYWGANGLREFARAIEAAHGIKENT